MEVEGNFFQEENQTRYRMYSLVVRQLSTMQKGVQTAHAIANYALYHSKDEDWLKWAGADQTLIVLDGGTCPEMDTIMNELANHNITHECFFEPDLYDMMTSIVLLVPEQVWDRENYPDYEQWVEVETFRGRDGLTGLFTANFTELTKEKWVEKLMGGEQNVFLRELLGSKRLAQ